MWLDLSYYISGYQKYLNSSSSDLSDEASLDARFCSGIIMAFPKEGRILD